VSALASSPATCQCSFVSHHYGPCGASGIYAIGKETRVTLCRECLAYLAGETRAAKVILQAEAAKRQTAGRRAGNEQKSNDSPCAPVGGNGHGAAVQRRVVQGFRFG
jgi:hypothetical protein